MTDTQPPPAAERGPEAAFDHFLGDGLFRIQRCAPCGAHIFYPRIICPHCGASDLAWVAPSGLGTVYATTVMRRPDDKGGAYNVCLVDLKEGPRMMSTVVGVAPDGVAVGMSVMASVQDLDGSPQVVFRPGGEPGTGDPTNV
ncbi:OB-fold domain-containing protein [Fodinicurvata sp. EGI_FJ10296]|uniref:Zn-ribbon domain-containing OB-fold protein n=1 Tax=Fodinicurvata sp. EGI_FJ10296 TaxID=3231908 RepID=UPI0034571F31